MQKCVRHPRAARFCVHAILLCAKDNHRTHRLGPKPAKARLTASLKQYQCVYFVIAVPAAYHAPCNHTHTSSQMLHDTLLICDCRESQHSMAVHCDASGYTCFCNDKAWTSLLQSCLAWLCPFIYVQQTAHQMQTAAYYLMAERLSTASQQQVHCVAFSG